MPNGSILLYYVMAYDMHLTNVPSIGVAQSTDGKAFAHRGVAYTPGMVSDPFPLAIDASGTVRLYFSMQTPGVMSVTATDVTGLHFGAGDSGMRSTSGGVPGALKIGAKYYLYVNGRGGDVTYLTSSDGLNFVDGRTTGLRGESLSPIDAGGGLYLMTYVCDGLSNARTHVSCIAKSNDGIRWEPVARIGAGSVPGLLKDQQGMLRVYVVSFAFGDCPTCPPPDDRSRQRLPPPKAQ
jgi:hypothetical protein